MPKRPTPQQTLVTIWKFLGPFLAITITLGLTYHLFSHTVKPEDFIRLINDFPPQLTVILLLISTLIFLIRAVRFSLLLRGNSIDISIWQAVKVFMAGQSLAPLPGGEG